MASTPSSIRAQRRKQNDFSDELARKGWYHSFELPDGTRIEGTMALEWERERWSRFPIPADLTGKRLLDIGSWDGWFSFEAERRGALVTSVDCVEVENYLWMHRRLGSRAEYRTLDFYELPGAGLGRFDVVLCLGVLYHLKHPFLAIEILCGLASDVVIIETFATDAPDWDRSPETIPTLEFYEYDELNGQMDNWCGPTVACLLAMCRAAGFPRVELVRVDRDNALVACFRKWEPAPANPVTPPPEFASVCNTVTFGINLSSKRDDYVTCWFRHPSDSLAREQLCLEIGEFGARPVYLRREDDGTWVANFRVPPGAAPGWNAVRLRLADSGFSNSLRIAIDMPLTVERLTLHGAVDALSFTPNEAAEYLSCWVEGLPENADRHNVRFYAGDFRLSTLWVGDADAKGSRQINAGIPADCPKGEHALRVTCAGVESNALRLVVR